MSPVSRGRKTRKSRGRRGAPTLEGVHAGLLRSFQPLATEGDPLEVEAFTSDVVGEWWQALPPDEDADEIFGLSAVEFAVRNGTPAAQALLRAFAAVGPDPELREAAAAGAKALAARGVAEPPWAGSIGRVEVGECWQFRDVYGDWASLYCEFSYGDERHVLVVALEGDPVEWAQDVWVGDQPDELLEDLRKEAAEEDLAVLERIDPAVARRRIEDAIAETDAIWQPEVSETFRGFRALGLARCAALPGPAPEVEDPEVPEQERAELVAAFLGSAEAKDLPEAPVTESCARLIVDLGVDYDLGRPLRVSPTKVDLLVHEWLPEEELDDDVIEALPAVLVAWTRWAAGRSDLPPAAVENVIEAAEECAGHLAEAYNEGELYLADVETEDPDELTAILERRFFAVPEAGGLNPGDPDERNLIIAREHPEYQQLLEDPAYDGVVDGVNPRLHLAMHQIVTNQLWDDDPPEVWEATRRLMGAGVDRHDILHQLMGVTAREPADPDRYVKALNALGRSTMRRIR